MNNDMPLSEQIIELSKIESAQKFNMSGVLAINDGHLRPSLYGMTRNVDLLTHTLASWIIALTFLSFGIGAFFTFGTLGVVVYMMLVEFMFIWLGLHSLKECKKVILSIHAVTHAVKSNQITYEDYITDDNNAKVTLLTSKNPNVSESLGTLAKFLSIFSSRQLLGAVILKHKNHSPFSIIMAVVCMVLIMMTHSIAVIISSIALLMTMVICFGIQGRMYQHIVVYFSGIKENLMDSLIERVDELKKEDVE